MSVLSIVIALFSVLGALDRIFGNRFGLGKEFEKGFQLLGCMALSMIGMIVLSPLLARLLGPCFDAFYRIFRIDPSVIPASLFANDMGGAPLSAEVARDPAIGAFNGLVVSSMMGCTISFTIPCSMEIVHKEHHREMMLGYLCGIVTIPLGCFLAGLSMGLKLGILFADLAPLSLFAGLIVCGLILCPNKCVKAFSVLGICIKILITAGLVLGIVRFLLGYTLIPGLATLEEGAMVCVNAAVVMTGAFPFMYLLSRLLRKPLRRLGKCMGISESSAMGFVATLATAVSTYEMMNNMDRKGIMLNSAFLVSAGFTFAGHLAFTMAFDAAYIPWVILAKLSAGIAALLLAWILYPRTAGKTA